MYKTNKFKRRYDGKPVSRRMSFKDIQVKDSERPVAEQNVNDLISRKALKDLPHSNSSIVPKVDPYQNALPGSDPYALINRFNPIIGGNYGGEENIDSGNIEQYASSERSSFLHAFDSITARCDLNYRYIPILDEVVKFGGSNNDAFEGHRGVGIVDTMIRSIDEILSLSKATTFTNLATFNYFIETDIYTGSFLPTTISKLNEQGDGRGDSITGYRTSSPEGLYTWLIFYQLICQHLAGSVYSFNKAKMSEGEMMRMSWNRNTPKLNALFGLYSKATFINQWESLAYIARGEYVDKDWLRQALTLTNIISRKAEDMIDPLLEVQGVLRLPHVFRLYAVNTSDQTVVASNKPIFDFDQLNEIIYNIGKAWAIEDLRPAYSYGEVGGFTGEAYQALRKGKSSELENMSYSLQKILSVNFTLEWARATTSGQNLYKYSDLDIFNTVSKALSAYVAIGNVFKPAMSDLRTMLDVLQRVGTNRWEKEVIFEVTKDTDMPVSRNILIEDFFKSAFAGSQQVIYDPKTYRWSGKTLWNVFSGIPAFDTYNGGSFLTFSSKDYVIAVNDDESGKAIGLTALEYLPVMVYKISEASALNRNGYNPGINIQQNVSVASVPELKRLIPITGDDVLVKVPVANIADPLDQSYLVWMLEKMFNIVKSSPSSDEYMVDSDLLCFVTFEIESITNKIITYARVNGPFSINSDTENSIGFLSLNTQRTRG